MTVELSSSTLISCRCAIKSHIDSLRSICPSNPEFGDLVQDQIKLYDSALAELDKIF